MGTLSVRENLYFSASLRLPSSTTRQQRKERVERVIEELGLQSCANTKVKACCCNRILLAIWASLMILMFTHCSSILTP